METSTIQKFKDRTAHLFEDCLLKSGRVLAVRQWENAAMTEIDLHLPHVAMEDWTDVPYIKCKAANFTYRDYTPFGWDAETRTCSLLVETAHQGAGSRWAASLRTGDPVQYLKIDWSHQSPHPTDRVVGLGDASSVGHLLALQQLTLPKARFNGAVVLDDPQTGQLLRNYFRSALTVLPNREELAAWLNTQVHSAAETHFYITGQNQLVSELRRSLKHMGQKHLRVKGFWS